MPSHIDGQGDAGLPRRLRPGSAGAERQQGARRPTGSRTSRARATEQALQAKGNIPNATNLLGTSVNERAAARSWFVPAAKHWVDVENGNILRTMLAQILTGKLTVKQAAASASDNITSTLNGPSRRAGLDSARWQLPPRPRPGGLGGAASRWRACRRGSVPYAARSAPVVVVLGAILGYPIYSLVRLSLQQIRRCSS